MTIKDKLEIGLKPDATYRKDNLPDAQVRGPEIPTGPGRSPEIPAARDDHNGETDNSASTTTPAGGRSDPLASLAEEQAGSPAFNMNSSERRGGQGDSPAHAQRDADHPAPRKNDEVPENRQAPDASHSDDDDERPHGDRRGS